MGVSLLEKQPWESVQPYNNIGTLAQDPGSASELSSEAAVPWWRQKNMLKQPNHNLQMEQWPASVMQ